MKNTNHMKLFLLGCFAFALAIPLEVNAWNASLCDGQINEGMQDNEIWVLDSCSMSATEQDIVRDGAFSWNSISNVADRHGISVQNLNCRPYNNDDDVWEIGFEPGSHEWLDGNNGVTKKVSASCVWPYIGEVGDGELLEADIIVNDSLSYSDGGELSTAADATATVIHEFGHAMGMEHVTNEFSVMLTPQPRFRLGRRNTSGSTSSSVRSTSISCEDARFAVARHGSSGAGRPDPYVSAFRQSGSSHVLNNNWQAVTHRGWFVNVNITLGNKGKQNLSNVNGKIVMSTDTIIGDADDISVLSFTYTQNAGFGLNQTLQYTVPSNIAAGQYHVGYVIDSTNSLTEDSEFNNAGRAGIILDVQVP